MDLFPLKMAKTKPSQAMTTLLMIVKSNQKRLLANTDGCTTLQWSFYALHHLQQALYILEGLEWRSTTISLLARMRASGYSEWRIQIWYVSISSSPVHKSYGL